MKHVTILTVFVTLLLEELCQNLALTRLSQLRAFFSQSEHAGYGVNHAIQRARNTKVA